MQLGRAVHWLGAIAASVLLCTAAPRPAAAQIGSARYASAVLDTQTGRMLFGSNAEAPRYPASLTKMMTLYMAFDAIHRGEISLDQRLLMTETAASRPPSKLGLPPGRSITVENAIYAVVTKSANDVASLLGETLGGGSEARFAQMMTLRARAIGMSATSFRNASGLPDIDQVTTARDMALLGFRLQKDFPEHYHFFGTRQYSMGPISLRNHNRMLDAYEGVDGIKTGYVNASGFNIVSSAKRADQRLIVVVFGGSSWVERDRHAAALLDRGFAQLGAGQDGGVLANTQTGGALALAVAAAAPVGQAVSASARPIRTVNTNVRAAAARPRTPQKAQLITTSSRHPPIVRKIATRTVIEQGDGGSRVRVRAGTSPRRLTAPVTARPGAVQPSASRPGTRR